MRSTGGAARQTDSSTRCWKMRPITAAVRATRFVASGSRSMRELLERRPGSRELLAYHDGARSLRQCPSSRTTCPWSISERSTSSSVERTCPQSERGFARGSPSGKSSICSRLPSSWLECALSSGSRSSRSNAVPRLACSRSTNGQLGALRSGRSNADHQPARSNAASVATQSVISSSVAVSDQCRLAPSR